MRVCQAIYKYIEVYGNLYLSQFFPALKGMFIMSQPEVSSVATEGKQDAETPMSLDDFVSAQTEPVEAVEETEEESEQSEEATEESTDATSESEYETEEESEVLSQNEVDINSLDLNTLSDEQLEVLAVKFADKGTNSRLVNRIGTIVKQRNGNAERAQSLEEQAARAAEAILAKKPTPEKNPYRAIETIEALQQEVATVDEFIEQLEDVIDNNEGSHKDDVVTEANGKDVTFGEVRKYLKDARKNRKEHLPAQLRVIQQKARAYYDKVNYDKKVREELPWMNQEDSEVRQKFNALNNGTAFAAIRAKNPELEPILETLAAHATNSMFNREEINLNTNKLKKRSTSITPPAAPNGASSTASRSPTKETKKQKAVMERIQKRGGATLDDFVNALS